MNLVEYRRPAMSPFVFRLPDEARDLLKACAKHQGVTEAKWVRRAVSKQLMEELRARPTGTTK